MLAVAVKLIFSPLGNSTYRTAITWWLCVLVVVLSVVLRFVKYIFEERKYPSKNVSIILHHFN
jgi:hypothetical protein